MQRLSRKPIQSLCINYSSLNLTPAQESLLSKHLSFVPIPDKVNKTQLAYDLKRFSRSMRWKEHFGSESDGEFRPEQIFIEKKHNLPKGPPSRPLNQMLYGIETDLFQFDQRKVMPNLSKEEKVALNELINFQKRGDIIIQRADKGGAVTIKDCETYISGINEHLT